MAEKRGEIHIPVQVIGADDVPILFANQFIIQHLDKEFILTFGQFGPPLLLGTEDQKAEAAKHISYVPIKVVARIGMTPERLVELIKVLQENLRRYEAKQ